MKQLAGYVVLGGTQVPLALPFHASYEGNLGARTVGKWVVESNTDSEAGEPWLEPHTLNIPSRDKQVQLLYKWTSDGVRDRKFIEAMQGIDSAYTGMNYTRKMNEVLKSLRSTPYQEFVGAVLNLSSSTHASIALLSDGVPIYVYGLFDQQLESAYLVWSTDPACIPEVMAAMPLRFLLYRFPLLIDGCIFLQIETLCAKWWRWNKNHQSTLQAFNALEWRLYGNAS